MLQHSSKLKEMIIDSLDYELERMNILYQASLDERQLFLIKLDNKYDSLQKTKILTDSLYREIYTEKYFKSENK
jgi:hypothetical protein